MKFERFFPLLRVFPHIGAEVKITDAGLENLLLTCANDSDASVRELALGILAQHKSSRLLSAATAQLSSPDPQIRLLGVQYLAVAEALLRD